MILPHRFSVYVACKLIMTGDPLPLVCLLLRGRICRLIDFVSAAEFSCVKSEEFSIVAPLP